MADTRLEFPRGETDDLYQETIALLQEEVARLEAELRAQQADDADLLHGPEAITLGPVGSNLDDVLVERDRLASELASREETIGLLLEQLSLVEEAERATRIEWEHLASWVAELEERVDQRDQEAASDDPERLLRIERRAAESEAAHERDRAAWDLDRHRLRRESERLRSMLEARTAESQVPTHGEAAPDARLKVLESELDALRQRCAELEAERKRQEMALNESLDAAREQLEEARQQVTKAEDERLRERRESETAVASIRVQLVRASLHAEQRGEEAPTPANQGGPLEADLRIREFRQHLREIHAQEEETRNRNSMSARLSRLWKRTAPVGSAGPGGETRP